MRGSLTSPGTESPSRGRSIDENLELFRAMTAGEMEDGSAVLRLKIDMASPNMNMRDPTIYRIKRDSTHPMTGGEPARAHAPSAAAKRASLRAARRVHGAEGVHSPCTPCRQVECLPDVRLRARAH